MMRTEDKHHFVADFSLLRGDKGVLCVGPQGVSIFDMRDLPLLLQLDEHRGNTLSSAALARLYGSTAHGLAKLAAHGLLVERGTARQGFSSVTLQSDDPRQADELAESLASLHLDLQLLDLDTAPPDEPPHSTLLVTCQQVYRPGYLSARRALSAQYFQLNAYGLGSLWILDPLYNPALGTPCHDCFLGRRAHLNASAKGPDDGDWLRFEYLLDEFKPLTRSRPSTPVERGLANFHLYRAIRSLVDAHAPRMPSEDLQSTLMVSLRCGTAQWQPLSHWDMCDCIQPGRTGGEPPTARTP